MKSTSSSMTYKSPSASIKAHINKWLFPLQYQRSKRGAPSSLYSFMEYVLIRSALYGFFWGSVAQICKDLKITERTYNRHLALLKTLGWCDVLGYHRTGTLRLIVTPYTYQKACETLNARGFDEIASQINRHMARNIYVLERWYERYQKNADSCSPIELSVGLQLSVSGDRLNDFLHVSSYRKLGESRPDIICSPRKPLEVKGTKHPKSRPDINGSHVHTRGYISSKDKRKSKQSVSRETALLFSNRGEKGVRGRKRGDTLGGDHITSNIRQSTNSIIISSSPPSNPPVREITNMKTLDDCYKDPKLAQALELYHAIEARKQGSIQNPVGFILHAANREWGKERMEREKSLAEQQKNQHPGKKAWQKFKEDEYIRKYYQTRPEPWVEDASGVLWFVGTACSKIAFDDPTFEERIQSLCMLSNLPFPQSRSPANQSLSNGPASTARSSTTPR